ncbi:hypothetical protein like AT1G72210 [Hibiscus trionum]|uniref:ACT domain-containing protein n=1 Tax=Hibiscus trionum TaxID=183268 RepID=A0A9W7M7R0_HIBTR|nr:hypothetical protein like AT1G72210 [Hibiscus trionum]
MLIGLRRTTQLFVEFSAFQISTRATQCDNSQSSMAATRSTADIEVTMAETHANLKILSKKRPKRLSKIVDGLQRLKLTVLHLNVTTADEMALYSVSVKIEEGCNMNTADEIAESVNQMLLRLQEEAGFS